MLYFCGMSGWKLMEISMMKMLEDGKNGIIVYCDACL